MALGRISGQLLQDNLTRAGTDLAFETNLLYLDVNNNRIGIKTIPTQYELEVNGTTRSTNFEVTNTANIANVTISGNTIQSKTPTLSLQASGLNSVIYNNRLLVGSLSVYQNTISGLTVDGDIAIQPNGTGTVNITGNTTVYGNLHATGTITADGNITLGNASTDTVTFDAEVNSNILPSTTATYNLGNTDLQWASVWATVVNAGTLNAGATTTNSLTTTADANIRGNTILGTDSTNTATVNARITSNLVPNANITYDLGNRTLSWNNAYLNTAYIGSVKITGNTVSANATGSNLTLTANGSGSIVLGDLAIYQNTISSTGINENINLTPSGTGYVKIDSTQSLIVPKGTTAERPASPQSGMVRFNTSAGQNTFEGYQGSVWLALGGVRSVDGNTKITPELTPGAADNTLRFYANGTQQASLNSTALTINQLIVNQLTINNSNVISATSANSSISLSSNGTGGIIINNFKITNNLIQNLNGAVLNFVSSGNGYFKFSGSNGVVIPTGTPSTRPLNAVTGMIRYNTVDQVTELYDGTQWVLVGGTQSGISQSTADGTAATFALIFG